MTATVDFAAVDLGASSGRVMAGQWDGSRFSLQEVHRFSNAPVRVGESYFWNTLEIWSQIKAGLALFRLRSGKIPASIGVDAWGVDYALLDSKDRLLRNPYCYRDRRTDGMVEKVGRNWSPRQIFQATGIQTMQINTLYQLYSEICDAPNAFSSAQTMLMIPDLFQFFLCGGKASEYTEATTSQLYSLSQKCWAEDLLCALNLPRRLFQKVVCPGTILGALRSIVLEDCGLCGSVETISVASHDTASAVAAIPDLDEHSAFLSSGTWSLMGVRTSAPEISEDAFQLGFTNEGAADGGVLLLRNLNGLWILQECLRSWSGSGQNLEWKDIQRSASSATGFQSWIDPNASQFQVLCDMPAAIAQCCRDSHQPVPQSVGEVARCLFESLSFSYRAVLDELQQLTHRDLRVLRIVGGGSLNQFFCQMIADATGRTIIAGPSEATAFGNVMAQAVATGHLPDLVAAAEAMKHSVECHTFQPALPREKWDEAYARFGKLTNAKRTVQQSGT
jgi:rhamnulokinase